MPETNPASGVVPKFYPINARPEAETTGRKVKTIALRDPRRVAVITRSFHGAPVLNTARILFVDMDLPEPKYPLGAG